MLAWTTSALHSPGRVAFCSRLLLRAVWAERFLSRSFSKQREVERVKVSGAEGGGCGAGRYRPGRVWCCKGVAGRSASRSAAELELQQVMEAEQRLYLDKVVRVQLL